MAEKRQPGSQSLHQAAPPVPLAPGTVLGGGCGRELEVSCQGHTGNPRVPSLLVVQIWVQWLLCPRSYNLREAAPPDEAPAYFWKQVPQEGPVCAEAWAGP